MSSSVFSGNDSHGMSSPVSLTKWFTYKVKMIPMECRALFCCEITQRAHDVNITSPQHRCNVMTLHWRWGDVIFTDTWRKYNVASMSMQRHDVDAMTLHRRWGDIIFTSCACREFTWDVNFVFSESNSYEILDSSLLGNDYHEMSSFIYVANDSHEMWSSVLRQCRDIHMNCQLCLLRRWFARNVKCSILGK